MSLDITTLTYTLANQAFRPHDHLPHFGVVIPSVLYLYREDKRAGARPDRFVYLSLVTYKDRLVEVVAESYLAPKNTRAPKGRATTAKDALYNDHQLKGFATVRATLLRSDADVLAFCAGS